MQYAVTFTASIAHAWWLCVMYIVLGVSAKAGISVYVADLVDPKQGFYLFACSGEMNPYDPESSDETDVGEVLCAVIAGSPRSIGLGKVSSDDRPASLQEFRSRASRLIGEQLSDRYSATQWITLPQLPIAVAIVDKSELVVALPGSLTGSSILLMHFDGKGSLTWQTRADDLFHSREWAARGPHGPSWLRAIWTVDSGGAIAMLGSATGWPHLLIASASGSLSKFSPAESASRSDRSDEVLSVGVRSGGLDILRCIADAAVMRKPGQLEIGSPIEESCRRMVTDASYSLEARCLAATIAAGGGAPPIELIQSSLASQDGTCRQAAWRLLSLHGEVCCTEAIARRAFEVYEKTSVAEKRAIEAAMAACGNIGFNACVESLGLERKGSRWDAAWIILRRMQHAVGWSATLEFQEGDMRRDHAKWEMFVRRMSSDRSLDAAESLLSWSSGQSMDTDHATDEVALSPLIPACLVLDRRSKALWTESAAARRTRESSHPRNVWWDVLLAE